MKEKLEDNVIYVGNKAPGVYSFSIKTIFEKGINEIKVLARGKSILTAINVVEYMKRNNQLEIKEIKLSSSELKKEEEKVIFVSSIEIDIIKKNI